MNHLQCGLLTWAIQSKPSIMKTGFIDFVFKDVNSVFHELMKAMYEMVHALVSLEVKRKGIKINLEILTQF